MTLNKISNMTAVLSILLFLNLNCTGVEPEEEPVRIRVENASSLQMNNIQVQFPEENVNYGDLPPGEESEYATVSKAYRYAFVSTTAGGNEIILQPIDFVGEKLLEPGSYTYILDINEEIFSEGAPASTYSLFLKLRED